ncbi:MAG TPA: hypothetical protein VK327_17545 [Candidatus Paceibacterota bacterium]|nr:hypothetical protein [Candidatus Paceibacterota bacterium]
MNPLPAFIVEISTQLRSYLTLCEDCLSLATRESQALCSAAEYQPFEFYQGRKALLSRLDQSLNLLRTWRQAWQRLDPLERAQYSEVKALLQAVQDALVKILLLDRENQQALLRRGLLPARHVSSFASQPPHYAAQLYRRHAT